MFPAPGGGVWGTATVGQSTIRELVRTHKYRAQGNGAFAGSSQPVAMSAHTFHAYGSCVEELKYYLGLLARGREAEEEEQEEEEDSELEEPEERHVEVVEEALALPISPTYGKHAQLMMGLKLNSRPSSDLPSGCQSPSIPAHFPSDGGETEVCTVGDELEMVWRRIEALRIALNDWSPELDAQSRG
ncbi:hypothetical protein HYH03_000985 [Edaphochlamys debaryana]|uniref:Uncharacterized protein n=1 Tax=Edaphochlamys debaryana TaxID=47281 RepID=A0A835YME0_9CHLO|nr:hypothetical protein HYH03_000985 [Edaphochlamys debaryana]|eukprot:KAG2501170.1 hypothetical protein HYH03_000985 [Edaphochlamys debaryana]